ncbi:MAG: hypothetical protein Kow0092_00560 [Deferrisomatales bacterium]
MRKRGTYSVLGPVVGSALVLLGWVGPSEAVAIEAGELGPCIALDLAAIHHRSEPALDNECLFCHFCAPDPATGGCTMETNLNCEECHGAGFEGVHDRAAYTPADPGGESCAACHAAMVTEHLDRGLGCATCHDNPDPRIQEVICAGAGPEGQPVFCVSCHRDAGAPFGIHNAGHDDVCLSCHSLAEQPDGGLLGIHDRAGAWCTDCHRFGGSDVERNSIFSVQVNADPGEPPDLDYDATLYLFGPCLKCHKKQKTNMGGDGRKGCLPCHFAAPEETWPTEGNGFFGSETWGHNFQKRNNEGRTVGNN